MGGYYDAGDHVKFGLPMAFTVTMLSWGAIDYRKEITGLNQMGDTLAAIKWGTDYFIKAHTEPDVLWGQVRLLGTEEGVWSPFSEVKLLIKTQAKTNIIYFYFCT